MEKEREWIPEKEEFETGLEELKKNSKKTEAKVLRLSLRVVQTSSKPHIEFDITEPENEHDETLQIPTDFSDGSRYIVMNNGDTMVYAYYSCIASFQMYNDYHIDLEKVLFEKMREMLGFKRIF